MTKASLDVLTRALELEEEFNAGIFPVGSSQHRQFRLLDSRDGLLTFEDYGYDIDGDREGEVPVYRLTESGRDVARKHKHA